MCALSRRKAMPAERRPGQVLAYMQDTEDCCASSSQISLKNTKTQTDRRRFREEVHLRFRSHSWVKPPRESGSSAKRVHADRSNTCGNKPPGVQYQAL